MKLIMIEETMMTMTRAAMVTITWIQVMTEDLRGSERKLINDQLYVLFRLCKENSSYRRMKGSPLGLSLD